MKPFKLPEKFRGFEVIHVRLPEYASTCAVYDIPRRKVFVNLASDPLANRMEVRFSATA